VGPLHVGDQLFLAAAFLPGADHDRRAVRVVGADVDAAVPAQLLEPHPDVGLDVLDQVADVDVPVGVGQRALASRFGVNQFPTFITVVDGREHARIVGKTSASELMEMFRGAETSPNPGSGEGPAQPAATFASNPLQPQHARGSAPHELHASQNQTAMVHEGSPSLGGPSALPGVAAPVNASDLISASVRLRVQDPDGASTGSGTVVDVRNGFALILTCGHLFRASSGKSPVEVTLFHQGAQGPEVREILAGKVLAYDLRDGYDLGLVHVPLQSPVKPLRIANPQGPVTPGEPVVSVGCNHGDLPSIRQSQVTHVNRYQGAPNVEAAGAPVEGRSGGGLFNQRGELIGVCFAADPSDDEGLYASSAAVCALLDEHRLSFVYQTPDESLLPASQAPTELASPTQPSPSLFAATSTSPLPDAIRGQSRPEVADPLAASGFPPSATSLPHENRPPTTSEAPLANPGLATAQSGAAMSPAERATLEEVLRRGANAEVIFIIRPLNSDSSSEVIKVNGASPEFVRALTGIVAPGAAPPTDKIGINGSSTAAQVPMVATEDRGGLSSRTW
jgi:hypothetical protein